VVHGSYNTPSISLKEANSPAVEAAAVNGDRIEIMLQNQGVKDVFVRFGGVADATHYHVVLTACSGSEKGDGGSYSTSTWKGSVSIFASSACIVSVTEFT